MLAATILVAGCSSGGGRPKSDAAAIPKTPFDLVIDQTAGLRGPARTARLVELAKAETGALSFYTVTTADSAAAFEKGFEQAYNLQVDVFRGDATGISERATQERAAGKPTADVVTMSGPNLVRFDRAGMLEHYTIDGLDLGPGAVNPWAIAYSTSAYVAVWNTNLVAPSAAPKSWEDLADPRWKGKLAMDSNAWSWYAALRDYWLREGRKSPAEVDRLFEAIVANASIVRGFSLMGQLLASGEMWVVASQLLNIAERDKAAGAPIAWQPAVQPVLSISEGVGVVTESARPATALLFIDWLLGPAQDLQAKLGKQATRPDLAPKADLRQFLVDDVSLADNQQEMSDRYDRLVSSGKAR